MIEYVRNILPRIQRFSSGLDVKEMYTDKPWIMLEGESDLHEYEFCRDGRLIMSLNGQVQFGKWEFRPSTQRLLIERPTDALLLQSAFVNNGLMILKKSGSLDPAFILVNRAVVPDMDVVQYLEKLVKSREVPLSTNTYDEGKDDGDKQAISVTIVLVILLAAGLIYVFSSF